jgi:hypothetical protein
MTALRNFPYAVGISPPPISLYSRSGLNGWHEQLFVSGFALGRNFLPLSITYELVPLDRDYENTYNVNPLFHDG